MHAEHEDAAISSGTAVVRISPMARRRLAIGSCVIAAVLAAGWLVADRFVENDAPRSTGGHPAVAGGQSQTLDVPRSPALQGRPEASSQPGPPSSDPTVAPPGALLVTVVDSEDRAVAEIPVDLLALRESPRPEQRRKIVVRTITDASGRASVAWPEGFAAQWSAVREKEPSSRLAVEAGVAWPELPMQDLGDDPMSTRGVVLRLSRGPRLDVEFVDASGALIREKGEVAVFWRTPGGTPEWQRTGTPIARAVAGHALFPIVPANLELLVRSTGTENWYWAEATVPPQSVDAGTVAVRCVHTTQRERVRVRVTDSEGQPVASVQLSVGFLFADPSASFTPNSRERPYSPMWAGTNAHGVLSLGLPGPARHGLRRVLFVERPSQGAAGEDSGPRLIGFLPVEHLLQPGKEIDVRLGVEELLDVLEGRVVDEDGRPIEGATVFAEYPYTEHHTLKRVPVARPLVTGPDGAFLLRSPHAPPVPVELRGHKQGYETAVTQANHGSRGLELRLRRR